MPLHLQTQLTFVILLEYLSDKTSMAPSSSNLIKMRLYYPMKKTIPGIRIRSKGTFAFVARTCVAFAMNWYCGRL